MGRVYFWCSPRAETINFHQFLAVGDDCSVETTQKRTGLRGCCQIPAASARSRLAVPLRQRGGVRRGDATGFQKYLGERGTKRSRKGGGECENTQADANPGFHSQANTPAHTYTRFPLCRHTMWLSGTKAALYTSRIEWKLPFDTQVCSSQ